MLDYEEYGSSFRTPRALRDGGAPANNTFNSYDGEPSQPEGRPAAAQPTDDEEARRKAALAQQATGATAPTAAPTAPTQTFSQMQAAGIARPPAPSTSPMTTPYDPSGTSMTQFGGVQSVPTANSPSGGSSLEDQLRQAYTGYTPQAPKPITTGQFSAPNSSMNPQIEQALMSAIGSPSRYDSNVVKDSFGYLSGAIDDDYNARDQGLRESLASRGLGAVGDGTIGTGDQRFQNLQRRSAKQNLASELLREQANTYGQDRASALSQAMGYGQNQFGQSLDAFNANQGANQQNWNQDFMGREFDAGQKQQAYNNYTGYGQQAFNNQMATSQMNNQQQQQQYDMLMKLLGLS